MVSWRHYIVGGARVNYPFIKATNWWECRREDLWIYESILARSALRLLRGRFPTVIENCDGMFNVWYHFKVLRELTDSIIAPLSISQTASETRVMMRFAEQFCLLNFSALEMLAEEGIFPRKLLAKQETILITFMKITDEKSWIISRM